MSRYESKQFRMALFSREDEGSARPWVSGIREGIIGWEDRQVRRSEIDRTGPGYGHWLDGRTGQPFGKVVRIESELAQILIDRAIAWEEREPSETVTYVWPEAWKVWKAVEEVLDVDLPMEFRVKAVQYLKRAVGLSELTREEKARLGGRR